MDDQETQTTFDAPLRGAARWAGGVILITLVVAALIFSNSLAARRVTDEARILDLSGSVLGTNALALKSLSQTLLLAEDLQLGVAEAETVQASLAETRQLLADLSIRTEALSAAIGPSGSEFEGVASTALESGDAVATLIEDGAVEQAGELLAAGALTAFEDLRDAAGEHRQRAARGVEATSDLISRLGSFPAFLVALLVPGIAILIYRRIAKSQLGVAEAHLDARLEAEHRIVVAKDEFVASISHELRTPLTTIYGFSEILLDQGVIDPAQATDLLTLINTESADLHRMVEDLLTTARSEAGTIAFKLGAVDLSEELGVNMTAMARTGVHIEADLTATEVWADAMRVRQILRNLLSNAHHHGGEHIRVTSQDRGDEVAVVVADNGDGVPLHKVSRLFTRYVHEGEDPLTTGSVGMGLAVVKILAEGMGGEVRYERQDGWSQFIVTLPSREGNAAQAGSTSGLVGVVAPPTGAGYGHQIAASQPLEEEWLATGPS